MEENELIKLKDIFKELKMYLQQYGDRDFQIQMNIISDLIKCIESDENEKAKEEFILDGYRMLYPPHGGLNDFYIQHDDFKTRLQLNEPVDNIKECLWDVMKKYV